VTLKSPFEFCKIGRDVPLSISEHFSFPLLAERFCFLTASRIRYLASLSETRVIFPNVILLSCSEKTVFHFATAASLGFRRSMNSNNSWHTPFLVFDCDAITSIRVRLDEDANGLGVRVLAGACGLSRYSCGLWCFLRTLALLAEIRNCLGVTPSIRLSDRG
jgi:hypothetical protein